MTVYLRAAQATTDPGLIKEQGQTMRQSSDRRSKSGIGDCTQYPQVPATAGSLGRFEVKRVDGDDMLQRCGRAGAGVYRLVGLPNGTVLQVQRNAADRRTRLVRTSR